MALDPLKLLKADDTIGASKDPERELVAAVLNRAFRDILNAYEKAERPRAREAFPWLLSPEQSAWSFIWCCECLDICPKQVRKKILTMYTLGTKYL
jgi:uncharacterized protein YecT (DUF1311 family)